MGLALIGNYQNDPVGIGTMSTVRGRAHMVGLTQCRVVNIALSTTAIKFIEAHLIQRRIKL